MQVGQNADTVQHFNQFTTLNSELNEKSLSDFKKVTLVFAEKPIMQLSWGKIMEIKAQQLNSDRT